MMTTAKHRFIKAMQDVILKPVKWTTTSSPA